LLAYVFWHVPRAGALTQAYEAAHREFHDVLRGAGIEGLLAVRVFRLAAVPWLGGRPGYEDWHLLEGSAGLDLLDRAAVSGARQMPHDRIAAMAGAGTAGLYALRTGTVATAAVAHWLAKPDGMSYQAFEASMAPHMAPGCALWGRRMTLGPTPEFCLHAPAACALPHPAQPIPVVQAWGWTQ
jgi:hypothetical protein